MRDDIDGSVQRDETHTEEPEPANIQVESIHGRLLTPCRRTIAEREVKYGRAQWVHSERIRLTYEPSRVRRYKKAVLQRDKHVCVWCGAPATTVDHIVPWSRGGSWFPHNLMAACQPCNHERLDNDARDYFERVRHRIPNPERVLRLIHVAERDEYVTRTQDR